MYLKAIELENFKSFGRKTRLEFKKGFTAISGPNGSGKSNITDAILFVLGPKSSKMIRAQRLTDLIYNGGKNGRPADYCKVSLIFENKDRILPIDEDEVKLTRYIKRANNEEGYNSYFYINDERARLQDFTSLLVHAKISAEGYNFVQQGDVTRIVEMTPLERRTILDDIAGITKYDAEIKKAEEKRKITEENMEKLDVLLDEIRRRIEILEKDREIALKYRELEERLRETRAKIAYAKMMSYHNEVESYRRQIEDIDTQIEKLKKKIEEKEERKKELKEEIEKIDRKIEEMGEGEIAELRKKVDDMKIQLAELRMKIENGEERIGEWTRRIKEIENSLKEIRRTLKERSEELKEKKKKERELEKRYRERHSALKKKEKEIGDADRRFREKQKELTKLMEEIEKKRKEFGRKTEEENRIRSEIVAIERRMAEKEEERKDVEAAIKDAQWRLSQFKEEKSEVEKKRKKIQKRYYELKNREERLAKELDEKDRLVRELKAEYERMSARMEASEDSMSRAVMAILAARDRGELRGIYGTIAELGNVDEKYEVAIEIAAGNRLLSIVCEDDESAARAIEYLKKKKLGRAIFLPLNKMLRGRPRGKAILASRDSHSFGFAIDLIKFDKKFEAAFWYVFGDTVVVDNLDNARRLMGGVRLVTLDGQLIEASGAMVGGSIERRKKVAMGNLEEIGERLRNAIAEKEEIERELKEVRREIDDLLEDLRNLSIQDNTSQIEIWKKEKKRNEEKIKQIDREIGEMLKRKREYESMLESIVNEKRSIGEKIREMEDREGRIREEMDSLIPEKIAIELRDLKEEVERINEELHLLRQDIVKVESELKNLQEKKENSEKEIENAQRSIEELERKIEEYRKEYESKEIEKRKLEEILRAREERIKDLVNEREKLSNELSKVQEEIGKYEGDIRVKEELKIHIGTKLMDAEKGLEDARKEYEEYGIEIKGVESLGKLKRIEGDIEREMESLGAVNMKSIEDYDREKERYDSIMEDYSKLKKEREDLIKLVKELNEKKKYGLMKVFNAINENFKKIYHEISNGGEAELVLENTEDPFQGGLIIKVKPVGKKFIRLESLSGGEKSLTALAFIFAIQQYDPSPLYVLDEVDMFLDGINAEIVGRVIKRNSQTAQFIVISLRKATIKFADHIIGVTQAGDGLSRVFIQSIPLAEVSTGGSS